MTLLEPTAALIAGLIAGPVLIAWHLLKLRRRPVRVSSTMFWRQAFRDLQVNVPLRWLRASWLLLLQATALGLLVLAIGRPALHAEGPAPGRVYLLIDRSASMSATDAEDGRSRLEEARRGAEEVARDLLGLGRRSEVGVAALAAEPVVLTAPTASLDAVRRAIRRVTPTDQPADLQSALRLLGALATEDRGGEEGADPPTVILFSDGALEAAESVPGLGEVRLVRVGGAAPSDNLGIVSLSARRDGQDPSRVRIFARVINAGREAVTAPVTLSVGGEPVESRAVRVPGGGSEAVIFEVVRPAGGLVTLTIDRADMLESDNAAGLVLGVASRPRILVVSPRGGALDESAAEEPVWLLTDVLTELAPAALSRVDARQYESMGPAGADLVVFDRVRPERLPSVPTMSFGAGLPIEGLSGPVVGSPAGYVLAWDRTHPVLRDVAMDTVFVGEHVDLSSAERVRGARVLASAATGPMIVLAEGDGPRRLVVGFEPWKSNWPLQAGFPVFVANAVDFLTLRGDESVGRSFVTGRVVTAIVPAGVRRVEFAGPERLTATAPEGESSASLGLVERAGVYRAEGLDESAGPNVDRLVVVNLLDPAESSLALGEGVRVGTTVAAVSAGAPVPREIWAWFALASLAVITLEWLLFAWQARV